MISHVYHRPNGGEASLRAHAADDAAQPPPALDVEACELVWVDIDQPAAEDIDWLTKTFNFHQLALEDVARRHQRAKIEEYPGYYFCVIYSTRLDLRAKRISAAELQFFWGKNYLVSIHSVPFPELDDLAARAREGSLASILGAGDRLPVVADLVYRLLDGIVDGYFPAVDALADWTEDIEETMFGNASRTQDTLQAIFRLRKDLIQLRKSIAPSRESI
jgi:magnesium transporter